MTHKNNIIAQYEALVGHLRAENEQLRRENEELRRENEELHRQKSKSCGRSRNRWKTYEGFGEKHTNAEWSAILGVPRNSLWRRLQAGYTIEEFAAERGIKYPNK